MLTSNPWGRRQEHEKEGYQSRINAPELQPSEFIGFKTQKEQTFIKIKLDTYGQQYF